MRHPGQRSFQRLHSLPEITPNHPEIPQRRSQTQGRLVLTVLPQPSERRPQLLVLLLQSKKPRSLLGPHQLGCRSLRQLEEVAGMGPLRSGRLLAALCLFKSELPPYLPLPPTARVKSLLTQYWNL
jgi:hypothetical protein